MIRLVHVLQPLPQPEEGFIGIRYDHGKPWALFGVLEDGHPVIHTQFHIGFCPGKTFLYALTPYSTVMATPLTVNVCVDDRQWCVEVNAELEVDDARTI